MMFRTVCWLGCLFFAFRALSQDIIINEIMYRPLVPGAATAEEWIELHNRGATSVNLRDWQITAGVSFRFSNNVTIPAGGYYVIAANLQSFSAFYPGVNNVVGGWSGTLNNNGERIELTNPAGAVIDEVRYATEGDWAIRRRGPLDRNHRGWIWYSEHDGLGKSLELINPTLSNDSGQNWSASGPTGGSPGARNSTHTINIAPIIEQVTHSPLVPTSSEAVTINARFSDEGGAVTPVVWWRTLANPFGSLDMFDDGEHNDGSAGDGLYGAILPPHGNRTVVEFYVQATDGSGNSRTWPAPALDEIGFPVQRANAIYQVDDEVYTGTTPIYRIVMTDVERQELDQLNSTSAERASDAQMNATFITIDPVETLMRYQCGFRIRGAGSRGQNPPNNRLNIPNDRKWKGVDRLSLNCQFTHSQLIGSVVAKRAGLNVADARLIQMRINGQNRATAAVRQFGHYVAVEVMNSDWAADEFPFDPDGNIYRASTGTHRANLSYYGPDPQSYINNGYTKESNSGENDWSDLINLTFVMSNTPPEEYAVAVSQVANIRKWMSYFATLSLMEYSETSLGTGRGDDYSMYRGISDPRFLIIAHDFDTIFAQGDTGGNVSQNIFQAANDPITPAIQKFLTNSALVPLYYEELYRLATTTFSAEDLFPLFDRYLSGWVPADRINTMKTFSQNRRAYVLSQIPRSISVFANSMPIENGYFKAPGSTCSLFGRADVIRTRFVLVNSTPANWDARNGVWTVNGLPLNPGVNRVVISTFDENGILFETGFADVWYDIGSFNQVSGAIGINTPWTPEAGPYLVSGTLQINNGATLTIHPGTSVYLGPNASIEVTSSGRLIAEGTPGNRIRFTRRPGVNGNWSEIHFNGAATENRLVNVDIEFSGASGRSLRANNAVVYFDGLSFTNTIGTYCSLDNSAFNIRNSGFPNTIGTELIHGVGLRAGGYGIIESNYFGTTTGLNDIIDFTGGQRPGPILQVLNNVFSGASDDVLDLDGADAHVEGNVFMNVHQETPGGDTASAISGGSDSGNTSEITIVRNFFYDCDYAALAKEGNFYTIVNNTMVNLTYAAVNFDEPLRAGITPGRGAYFDGNIVRNAPADFENTNEVAELTVLRSILTASADPKLVKTNATLATLTNDLSLRPGSIAMGTGPNGLDIGAAVPAGASISGEPHSPTSQNSATLIVDGPGITHYRYNLNGGSYGAETPVSTPITLNGLANGTYTVSVVGKNSAGVNQPPNFSRSWTVNTGLFQVRLNEVLARNENVVINGNTPDFIELYNAGSVALDLSGMGLTDDPAVPKKFTFAPGTTLGGGQYLTVYADDQTGPGLHTGFGLNQNGDGVWLFNANSGLRDSITFGFQAGDYSIGRRADGSWGLTRPTFAAANIAQTPADARYVKINEWLARGRTLYTEDFVELYNLEPVPADLSGVFITDAPQAGMRQHQVPPLSFIDGYGYFVFTADGNTNAGPEHLGFQLSSDQGEIAMFASDGSPLDCIIYGPQTPDVSEGRRPNGAVTIASISPPTPNAPNPALIPGITVSNVVTRLLPMDAVWTYNASGTNLGTAWRANNYNDSTWLAGPGILAEEDPGVLPPPGIGTDLPLTGPNGFIVTFYFRTQFVMPETNMPGSTLTATFVIDDGAVIYTNGVEWLRRRVPANQTFSTFASQNAQDGTVETVALSFTNFPPGSTNYIAAEVHQGGLNSSDVVFGFSIETTHLVTNFPPRGLVMNEVMANNNSITNAADNSVTDWIEFLNPSTDTINLANMSISDDLGDPRRWVFPPGVTIAPQSYLIVKFDSAAPPSTNAEPNLNTGFGLNAGGDQIFLFAPPEDGGDVLDSLAFGIQAADFTVSRVPEVFGAWRLSFPTLRSVNVPAVLGSTANLRINEWLANPSGNDNDFFEIYNPEAQPVDLSGLHLTDNLNNHTQYRIPPLSFIGVGEQGFAEFIADGDPEDGADHVNFRLSAGGEALGLFTASGGLIDALSFGSQDNGVSEGRFPDGSDTVDRFPDTATPGASNMRRLTEIVINEVLSHTDLPLVDAIELFNPSASSVDLSGWFISDRRNEPRKFRIPDGTVLQPGGFIVYTESDFNPLPGLYPSFALSSSEGENLFLFAADEGGTLRGYRADVEFGAAENAVSFGQYETSIGFDFTALSQRTLGASNAYPKIGPVVITEVMYHPRDIGTEDNVGDEYIELLNISGATLPLYDVNVPTNTWRLRDAVDFDFPQGLTLPTSGYLLVVGFDPATNDTQVADFRLRFSVPGNVPILGPFQGRLANDNENIELYKPDGPTPQGDVPYIQVDKVRYADTYPWASAADGNTNGVGMSLQRRFNSQYGNDPVNWVAANPTAGGPTAAVSASVPAITQQPQSRTVIVGATTNFSVTATGQALRYQWRFNGVNIPRATNTSYSISTAQITNNGVYSVLVANSLGAVLSAKVTLTVQTPPSIVNHPQDRLVPPGETAIFTVTAQGTPPLRYQWKINDQNLPGETNPILAISNVQTNKEGRYSVQVSNDYGTTNSQYATLTVRSVPIIATQPQSTNVFTSSTVTFRVVAFGTAPLRYFWRFNDNPIPDATNDFLTLANVQLQQAGGYSVLITNNIGPTLSAVATLTVTVPPVATVAAFDASASESGGDSAVFTLTRTGTLGTPLDIFFTIGGSAQLGGDYSLPASPVRIPAGAASAQLVLTAVNDGQREPQENVIVTVVPSAQYVVGAAASATATIADDDNSVPQVQISAPTDNSRFTVPTNVTISAVATDADGPLGKVEFFVNVTNKIGEDLSAPFSITWTNPAVGSYSLTARATDDVGATAISAPSRIVIATAGFADMFAHRGVMAGYTNYFTGNNSAYTKESGEPRHHHNGNGNGTRSAWLSWTAPLSGTVTMNTLGSAFDTVMVVYTNSNPNAPTLANLVRVVSNDEMNNTNSNSQVVFNAVAGATYQIAADGYTVGVGGALVFRMNLPNPNPIIIANPTNQLVNPGSTVTFRVTAGGPGPLRYQWRFGGADIPGATGTNLILTGVQAANQGIYTVVVSNDAGSITSSPATLALRPPPSITTPLTNRVVNPGGSATFAVSVSGTGPFTYQWRHNGSIIPGATFATLAQNNLQHASGGTYTVIVSNSAGPSTSEAELIVRPLIAHAVMSDNVLLLAIDATPGKNYFVQTSTNFTDWTDLQVLAPSAIRTDFQTPVGPSSRLYRLRVP